MLAACGLLATHAVVHTKLATGIAFHRLSLTVAGKVVGATALVASGRARAASEASPEASIAAAGAASSTAQATSSGVRAIAGQMASQAAAVATSARASSAQAQSRAVRLDVAEALAVVALLRWGTVSRAFTERKTLDFGAWYVLSVVRGWGHPFDSWPGCLPIRFSADAQPGWPRIQLTVVAEPLGRRAHLYQVHVSRVLLTQRFDAGTGAGSRLALASSTTSEPQP